MAEQNPIQKTKVITGKVRLSYVHLFEPQAVGDSGNEKYSASLIIPKTDTATLDKVKNAIKEAVAVGKTSKFDGKVPANLKLPLRDGDEERSEDEAYADAMFMNATANTKPGVIDLARKVIENPEELYSGCYAVVSINFYAYNRNGNKGIACGLNNVMKIADGEPLGGRINAVDDFANVEYQDDTDIDSLF